MKTRARLAAELFKSFETHGIPYAVVGDVRGYPELIRGDLDLLIDPSALRRVARHLRDFFAERDVRLVQVLQHEQTAWCFVFAWEDDTGSLEFLQPDICGDYYRGGRLFLRAEEILSSRVQATDIGGENLFQVPAPPKAFLYYLLKRVEKGELDERHGSYLSGQWQRNPHGAEREIRRFWTSSEVVAITTAAESGDWSMLRPLLPGLRKSLLDKVGWRPSWFFGELRRVVRRFLEPTGIWVAFLGPDGSGKSTIIERVRVELAPAFPRSKVVHLRPALGRQRSQSGPVTEPHGEPSRGWFFSLLKLVYWLVDYSFGYVMDTRPAITRSTLVLYDRYYTDLLVDPVRYRFGGSLRLGRALQALIPHPDLYVFLDVPATESFRRKGELSIEEIDRQRKAYRELAREIPSAHLVDASSKPDLVAREVVALIREYLEDRVTRRLALSKEPSTNRS